MKKYAPYAPFRDNYMIINSIKKGRIYFKAHPKYTPNQALIKPYSRPIFSI